MAIADLVTSDFCNVVLAAGGLTPTAGQAAHLANAIAAASRAFRRACGDRDFTRTTYDRTFWPAPDGRVALDQIPVNAVLSCRGGRTEAINIWNADSTTNYRALVRYTSTGDWDSGLAVTGLSLDRYTSAGLVATPLLFATYTTVGALATAINALGGGWRALAAQGMANWATSDLASDDVSAQGCLAGTDRGATLEVYADDLAATVLDRDTGLIRVSGSAAFGPSWGPDWTAWGDTASRSVRVRYDAGFATVPLSVQEAVAEIVKGMLERLGLDSTLRSERAGAYQYDLIALDALQQISRAGREEIARWRITRA